MKKTTPSERMREVLSALGITANDFENRCGMGHGFVSRVTRVITKKQRAKIKMAFPTINMDYVALGTGDMFSQGEAETPQTIKERIKLFCAATNIPEAEFVRTARLAESFIKNMSDNVRGSSLEKIYKAYPALNPLWLEYGEGSMITDEPHPEKEDNYKRIDALIDFLGVTKTQFTIETKTTEYNKSGHKDITKKTVDRIVERYPFVNPLWLLHGRGDMIAVDNTPTAPVVSDLKGYPKKCNDKRYLDKQRKIPYVESEELKGNIIGFDFGDIVIGREIDLKDYKKMPLPFEHYDFILISDKVEYGRILDHNTERGTVTFDGKIYDIKDFKKAFVAVLKITRLLH